LNHDRAIVRSSKKLRKNLRKLGIACRRLRHLQPK
jgi:hypothetical protein